MEASDSVSEKFAFAICDSRMTRARANARRFEPNARTRLGRILRRGPADGDDVRGRAIANKMRKFVFGTEK